MTEEYYGQNPEITETTLIDNEDGIAPEFSNEKVDQAFGEGLIVKADEENFRNLKKDYSSLIKTINFSENFEKLTIFLKKLEAKFPFTRRSSLFHIAFGSTPPEETIAFDFVDPEDSIVNFMYQEMERIDRPAGAK
ncbi:MAG: hypothetical protein WCW56_01750 [Candidatus Paceibacterota bacterium]|jgi:hypothetical protein